MPAHADLATGFRRLPEMGNVQHNLSWSLTLAPGTYYYSVQAVDTGFMGGPWSPEGSFTIAVPPGAFTLTAPADAAGNVSVSPTFSWTASAGASAYALQVSPDSGFLTLAVNESGLLTTTRRPSVVLALSTPYYWRVTATNAGGPTVASGAPFSFTTTSTMNVTLGGCGLSGLEVFLPLLGWLLLRRRSRAV